MPAPPTTYAGIRFKVLKVLGFLREQFEKEKASRNGKFITIGLNAEVYRFCVFAFV